MKRCGNNLLHKCHSHKSSKDYDRSDTSWKDEIENDMKIVKRLPGDRFVIELDSVYFALTKEQAETIVEMISEKLDE